ncbi:hypothetical protein LIA77_08023 [Sarocladium implicatum]|nr:hypothetical protein LIA77_08023 [Sarocladium implicatum]
MCFLASIFSRSRVPESPRSRAWVALLYRAVGTHCDPPCYLCWYVENETCPKSPSHTTLSTLKPSFPFGCRFQGQQGSPDMVPSSVSPVSRTVQLTRVAASFNIPFSRAQAQRLETHLTRKLLSKQIPHPPSEASLGDGGVKPFPITRDADLRPIVPESKLVLAVHDGHLPATPSFEPRAPSGYAKLRDGVSTRAMIREKAGEPRAVRQVPVAVTLRTSKSLRFGRLLSVLRRRSWEIDVPISIGPLPPPDHIWFPPQTHSLIQIPQILIHGWPLSFTSLPIFNHLYRL